MSDPKILSNPALEKSASDAAARAREEALADWRAVLATKQGRNVLRAILQETRWDELAAVSSGSETYFNDGGRRIGISIRASIREADRKAWNLIEQGE